MTSLAGESGNRNVVRGHEIGEIKGEQQIHLNPKSSYNSCYDACNAHSSFQSINDSPKYQYIPFQMEMVHESKGKFYFSMGSNLIQEMEFGPILSSNELIGDLEKFMAQLHANSHSQPMLVCRDNRSIRGVLFGLAQAYRVNLSSFSPLFEYFIYDCNSLEEMVNNLPFIKPNELVKQTISQEYQPVPRLDEVATISPDHSCTLALKLNSCKDQSLNVIWSWFYGFDIISGGICPLINKFGSGSRSQDILVQFHCEEHSRMAMDRWTQKWHSLPPGVETFKTSVISCALHKSTTFKSIFEDVHLSCKRFLQQMSHFPEGAIVRLKGLTFQTTTNQLLTILKREISDLPINDADEEGSIVMPMRGNQQSLKTGDAFVLCRDTQQALQVKQRFTHFHHGQRTWEVYLSSVGEMIQVFRAHSKGEFVSRNKRSNPFTSPSSISNVATHISPIIPLFKPDMDDTSSLNISANPIQPLFSTNNDKLRGISMKNSSQVVPSSTPNEGSPLLHQANQAISISKVPLPFSSSLSFPVNGVVNLPNSFPSLIGNIPILCGVDSNPILSQNIILGLLNSSLINPAVAAAILSGGGMTADSTGLTNSLANPFFNATPFMNGNVQSAQLSSQSFIQPSISETLSMYPHSGYLFNSIAPPSLSTAMSMSPRHPITAPHMVTNYTIPFPTTSLIHSIPHNLLAPSPLANMKPLNSASPYFMDNGPSILPYSSHPPSIFLPNNLTQIQNVTQTTNGKLTYSCSATLPVDQSMFYSHNVAPSQ